MPRLATSPDDLLSPEDALKLSGLEYMQSILDGTNPGPPIGGTMGYTLHSVEKGRCVFRGTPQFNVTNPMGTVHGGWYGTLLDSAMACAVMTGIPKGIRGVEDGKLYATGSTTCIVMKIA